jgi:hypothetical protein
MRKENKLEKLITKGAKQAVVQVKRKKKLEFHQSSLMVYKVFIISFPP